MLTLAVVAQATRTVDLRVVTAVQTLASPALDVAASLLTVLGRADVTAVVALALAGTWSWREGARGLVPLLLFLGVALEIVMKQLVSHPGPPRALWRMRNFLPSVEYGTALAFVPYAFPSGHLLRTTFLVALVAARTPRWTAIPLTGLVLLVGLAHVYLATHWASDVTGGLLAGLLLARIGVAVRRRRAHSS